MDSILLGFSDALGLISIDLEKPLGFNDVETEVIVLSDRFFSGNQGLDRTSSKLVQELLNIFLLNFRPHN